MVDMFMSPVIRFLRTTGNGVAKMYDFAVWVSVVLTLGAAFCYAHSAWNGTVRPVLATWILVETTLILSAWMYLSGSGHTWEKNVGLSSGCVGTGFILTSVCAVHVRNGTLHMAFDTIQKWCLVAGGVVTIFWFMTSDHLLSYILVQVIALIGYGATVVRLLRAKYNTEPMAPWILSFFAVLLAIYPAIATNDMFAYIFLGRTIPSISLVIFLMFCAKKRGEAIPYPQ